MKKERLTRENITADVTVIADKQDLRDLVYRSGFVPIFLICGPCGFYLCRSGYGIFVWLGAIVIAVPTVFLLLIFGIIAGRFLKRHRELRTPLCLVKDTLDSMEIKEQGAGIHRERFFYFRFKQYGEVLLDAHKYFSWSSEFQMSRVGLYNSSKFGDEFYLVLSEPHTGRILTVYPAKWFEPEDALGPFLIKTDDQSAD